ncbi:MAG: cob(I)alamin adenosyltransferase [Acidimicrobiaceae bacterium]|jgi:cob(I)alamin adenosyltransferase|nr:cob(I)alamin adenosyltransferase [Acidimicrobiaceae bacterium]MDQ1443888.1 cob(I)alamin adenosyltransferase [Acidimicrobiaceae bacterium]
MTFYTKKGDDGTTGLYYGGRVRKDSDRVEAYGTVDEAQAAMGVARAELPPDGEAASMLLAVQRDLYVLMAELATGDDNRAKLVDGQTMVSEAMVDRLATWTDEASGRFEMPREFVIPGQDRVSALLEVARTVVRRAERDAVAVAPPDSHVVPYLNRLSSLLWAMARWQEGEAVFAKER